MNITEKMNEKERLIYARYCNEFPFPIVSFINDIGLKVFISDDLANSVSGAISKHGNEYHIMVNGKHSENRMRFTLAHELAHYFNDKDYLDDIGEIKDESRQSKKWLFRDENNDGDNNIYARDVCANQFAAEILMPREVFIAKWRDFKTPEEVSKYFKVSIDAVRVRASYLLGEII